MKRAPVLAREYLRVSWSLKKQTSQAKKRVPQMWV